jgi:hypothetical protein
VVSECMVYDGSLFLAELGAGLRDELKFPGAVIAISAVHGPGRELRQELQGSTNTDTEPGIQTEYSEDLTRADCVLGLAEILPGWYHAQHLYTLYKLETLMGKHTHCNLVLTKALLCMALYEMVSTSCRTVSGRVI